MKKCVKICVMFKNWKYAAKMLYQTGPKNSVLNMLKILFISMVLTIQAHVQATATATSPCIVNSLQLCQCLCQKDI